MNPEHVMLSYSENVHQCSLFSKCLIDVSNRMYPLPNSTYDHSVVTIMLKDVILRFYLLDLKSSLSFSCSEK